MGINRNNLSKNDKFNENNSNYIININTGEVRKEKVKVYRICWKCGASLPEGSVEPFCNDYDNYCRNEYYRENAREIDSVWREITGRD